MTWRSAVSLFGAGSNDFLRISSRPDHAPVGQGAASPVGSVEHRVTGDEPSVGRCQETKLAHEPDPKGGWRASFSWRVQVARDVCGHVLARTESGGRSVDLNAVSRSRSRLPRRPWLCRSPLSSLAELSAKQVLVSQAPLPGSRTGRASIQFGRVLLRSTEAWKRTSMSRPPGQAQPKTPSRVRLDALSAFLPNVDSVVTFPHQAHLAGVPARSRMSSSPS
jgi:hypothetical protein